MSKKENVIRRNTFSGRIIATSGKYVHNPKQLVAGKHPVSGQHLNYSQLVIPTGSFAVRRERMVQVIPDVDMALPLASKSAIIRAAIVTQTPIIPAPAGQEYIDPFLFETGHFESREEYEELSRTTKIKPRARA